MREAPAHPYPRRAQPPVQPEIPGSRLEPGSNPPPQTQPHPVPRSQAGKGFLLTSKSI
jgi:hypothetical protein